ncbi:hypothetical protein P378_03235 [Desulforamulus profundi]|uniref:Uncharacterized protein n=1 Tax=Desulforamulus profundi TaxID=1383067 RepID=A0A2C6MI29_9FIRM|nr:hypothetical protein [Desulforamulus profundi]PHJ39435.1 hypothetical protein P378_03235 [Desulforamulus profundi]
MNGIKEYKYAIVLALCMLGLYVYQPPTGAKSFDITVKNIQEMLAFLPQRDLKYARNCSPWIR